MEIENDKDYSKWSKWLEVHQALDRLCCQETCECWDIQADLSMYEMKQGNISNLERTLKGER